MLTIYDYELSAECYAVRLYLAILGVEHTIKPIDAYPGREHERPPFRTKSPFARLPVLETVTLTLWDWRGILIYLAAAHDRVGSWYPTQDAARLGRVSQWMSIAQDLQGTAGLARLHDSMFVDADIEKCRALAHDLLRRIDEHLWFQEQTGESWLVDGKHPSLADLALFPHVMLSEEGGVDRRDYPAIRRWCDRFKRTPGFIGMSGIFPAAHGH
ncbi:glutathione S-transferase C-terminal domain-containing protein [Hyphomicrobium sp. CS1GBMeth3]|uniref:glutathione S-transferase family protein n=1 Tax=Hyphomicrobium sp. CS1GBMeth3 TaxID=1892845 RepID=UPI000931C200|nr:glutathione S-transferase C-terminal domain-containing protein [Hyphomicrobium sp. CS1GBMeth3]